MCCFFYLNEQTAEEKGVHISSHSSWPLILSSIFINAKSIIKFSPLRDEHLAQGIHCWITGALSQKFLLFYLTVLPLINHLEPVFSNNERLKIQLLPVGVAVFGIFESPQPLSPFFLLLNGDSNFFRRLL